MYRQIAVAYHVRALQAKNHQHFSSPYAYAFQRGQLAYRFFIRHGAERVRVELAALGFIGKVLDISGFFESNAAALDRFAGNGANRFAGHFAELVGQARPGVFAANPVVVSLNAAGKVVRPSGVERPVSATQDIGVTASMDHASSFDIADLAVIRLVRFAVSFGGVSEQHSKSNFKSIGKPKSALKLVVPIARERKRGNPAY